MARYRIVPERSRLWIDGRSTLHPIRATTDGLEGFVDLEVHDGGQVKTATPPAGRLTLPVTRLSAGNSLEDSELRRRIDTKRFPTIEGVLTSMEAADGAGRYRVRGDLQFRGVTQPCEDEMTIDVVDDHTVRLQGSSTFDIRDFGMQAPRILLLRVEPEVTVRVDIVAEREPD